MGIQNITLVLTAALDLALVGDTLLNKGNLLSAFQFIGDFQALANVNFPALQAEIASFTDAERAPLEALVVSKLSLLQEPAVVAKVKSGVPLLETGIQLVEASVNYFNQVKVLFA